MSHSFKAAVKKALNRPIIVADRFHFCRYIYWALDGVRRRVQSAWGDYDRKKCKKMRHVFYKNSENLTEKERWYLDRYCQMSEELKVAYQLKEEFCQWLKQAKQNGCEKVAQSKEKLYEYYALVEKSGLPEFKKAFKHLKTGK